MAEVKAAAEALVPRFRLEKLLNQDQAGRRVSLLGAIDAKPALMVIERAPFPDSPEYLASVPASLEALRNLGANDVYHWFMAKAKASGSGRSPGNPDGDGGGGGGGGDAKDKQVLAEGPAGKEAGAEADFPADLKINLIYPCTPKHVAKFSKQAVRFVVETPAVYRAHVRPFMAAQRNRLTWVYNILDGRTEVDDVIYRSFPPRPEASGAHLDPSPDTHASSSWSEPPPDGFLLLPDLNWDRRTVEALHLLALVERRDLWSLRDLRRRDLPWLRAMRAHLLENTAQRYGLDPDQLKLYVHYQPTYYHFHVHIVHVALDAGPTQAIGKAISLDAIVNMLENLGAGLDGHAKANDEAGMELYTLSYTLGEASDLWNEVFEPLKKKPEDR